MSLIRRTPPVIREAEEEELMPLAEAAKELRLGKSTIRLRQGGTEHFTHVRQGSPGSRRAPIFLLRSEIIAHKRRLIAAAREQNERTLRYAMGS